MPDIVERLEAIAAELKQLEIGENSFLESINGTDEFVIKGNLFGLLYLARTALLTAIRSPGAHQHFDETSMLDSCEKPFVIARTTAEWERGE